MSTLATRHRLRGLRTQRDWRRVILRAIAAATLLAATVAGLAWTESTLAALDNAQTSAITASHKVTRLEQTWVSCLENKGVWIGDELHTCHLLNTRFARSDFRD